MFSFNDYINNKKELLKKIITAKENIADLETMGIDVSESLLKLDNAINIVENDKISIVLVGAFSDGKTSVVAGWINEKLDNMKIDSDESSDEILCYKPNTLPNDCVIVDTPGLFGDKKGLDDAGAEIALSDLTKKFISEANIILYVVTAKNPIKDTHKECIRWILKDLNKLSSTIFVINRMDDVADLTDEEDFNQNARIKSENIRNKLLECGLTSQEASKVNIACISADPNGRGLDIWNGHREEYLRRSHLNALENLTNEIMQNSRENLITKTGCDILNDEISKMIDLISEQEFSIKKYILPELKEGLKRNQKDLTALRQRILRSKVDMKKELKSLKDNLIAKIRAASMENFKKLMEDEIGITKGKEGYVLNEEINNIFSEYAEQNSNWIKSASDKIQLEYNKQNDFINKMLKSGANGAAAGFRQVGNLGVDVIKKGIFAGRDLLGKIGIVIKFKPWQVTKMATFASKAFPMIGAGIDLATNLAENIAAEQRNRKFEKQKAEIKEAINSIFYEIYEMINSDETYLSEFAPQYDILKKQIEQDENDIIEQEEKIKKFKTWKAKYIDIDFIEH